MTGICSLTDRYTTEINILTMLTYKLSYNFPVEYIQYKHQTTRFKQTGEQIEFCLNQQIDLNSSMHVYLLF